jgi:excisionase family DNA binding protein
MAKVLPFTADYFLNQPPAKAPKQSRKPERRVRAIRSLSKLYTSDEAAEILRVKRDQVYDYVYAGLLKAIKLGKGRRARIRISEDALLDFLNHAQD